jgi:superfamily II DNA/RNA helicase
MKNFNEYAFTKEILANLDRQGMKTPTPVQEAVVPEALKGQDVVAAAQTGSGKTLAFLLPIIQNNMDNTNRKSTGRFPHSPRSLILTPTRELAEQIFKVAETLTKGTDIKTNVLVGGVPIMKHKRMLKGKFHITVATPGRLLDLMNQGDISLDEVSTLVLDEADRMLDMGFRYDIQKIASFTAQPRQTLLLSATLDGKIKAMIDLLTNKPITLKLTNNQEQHSQITQSAFKVVGSEQKKHMLKTFAEDNQIFQAVIFTNSKHLTERLCGHLKGFGEKAEFLHGDMRQNARKAVVNRMQKGQIRFLVATDVAARGLDIKNMTHVIHYDLPQCEEDYIHRCGRVGRNGAEGTAYALVASNQHSDLKSLERFLGRTIDISENPEGLPAEKASAGSSRGKRQGGGGRSAQGGGGRRFEGGGRSAGGSAGRGGSRGRSDRQEGSRNGPSSPKRESFGSRNKTDSRDGSTGGEGSSRFKPRTERSERSSSDSRGAPRRTERQEGGFKKEAGSHFKRKGASSGNCTERSSEGSSTATKRPSFKKKTFSDKPNREKSFNGGDKKPSAKLKNRSNSKNAQSPFA